MSHPFATGNSDPFLRRRQLISVVFAWVCRCCTWGALLVLAILLGSIGYNAIGWLDWQFLTSPHSADPEKAGLFVGIWGSFWMIIITMMVCVPIGVGTAIYLEEYAGEGHFTRLIKLNLANLAGVPSIVYGMLGLAVFARMFGIFSANGGKPSVFRILGVFDVHIPFGRSVLTGSLTMALLMLPIVVIATQEALKSVPPSIRTASFALGASRWQTIRFQVLPASIPGIITGVILAVSRAMGETAPLIMIGSMLTVFYTPGNIESPLEIITSPGKVLDVPFSNFTTMPVQIFNWVGQAKPDFYHAAAAGIVTLLFVLLGFNALAVWIRHRASKKIQW
ncbi:MAG: phosphate ABC transporter permease PstA [Planctomycetaceae bacterium]